jgi:hypothetical protein
MDNFPPTLSPIGSVDTSSSNFGVVMFNMVVDTFLVTSNNIIQFEYQISNDTAEIQAPDSYVSGFIPLENAVTTQGIANQFTIAVPATDNDYEPTTALAVKIRVYYGSTSSSAINVTDWSNRVVIHNPPEQPTIRHAYLVRSDIEPYSYYQDYLYVQLKGTNTPYVIGYDKKVEFVVTYYYLDTNSVTRWIVTNISVDEWDVQTVGTAELIVLDPIGLPTDVDWTSSIYVAVFAVYPYDVNGTYCYAVSTISDTVTATEAGFLPAELNPITNADYSAYTQSASSTQQSIELSWQGQDSSLIPNYAVDSYIVYVSTGSGRTAISPALSGDVYSYTYTFDNDTYACGTTLTFTVDTVFSAGQALTSNSESINIFKRSQAVGNFTVDWAVSAGTQLVDFAMSWTPPSDSGCGIEQYFEIIINDGEPIIVTWSSSVSTYVKYINNYSAGPTGSVVCIPYTKDTNSTNMIAGYATAPQNYQATSLPIIRNITRSDDEVTFEVSSHTTLDLVGRFIFANLIGGTFSTIEFNSDPNLVHYDYVVTQTTQPITGVLIYTFVFSNSYFTGETIPSHFSVVASNGAGVGFNQYNSIPVVY